jgi:5-methyltetrahydrofolate--homocysteine methyltransferase
MSRFNDLVRRACERIVLLDGAMGTMIQTFGLNEDDYRGARFCGHSEKLAGCNDVLTITKPEVIKNIHAQYLQAEADIIETCSFSANAISLADYGLAEYAYEISRAAACCAREAAAAFSTAERPRFVAGVLGPTTKSAAIASDPSQPSKRALYWDELYRAYYDNARGLLDGGADVLLIETIFDTLNAKAAVAACLALLEERGIAPVVCQTTGGENEFVCNPIMLSASVSDKSGRLLCGQSVEAFCTAVSHARPFSIGLNCSLGAAAMESLICKAAGAVRCFVSAHPNAGLPNKDGLYDQTPEEMAAEIQQFIDKKYVNIVGGCCGSTPAHIAQIVRAASTAAPRPLPPGNRPLRLCGLDVLEIGGRDGISIIGEGGNAPGSKKFLAALRDGNTQTVLGLIRANIAAGAVLMDLCTDDGLLDSKTELPALALAAQSDPEIARLPFVPDSSDWDALEAAVKSIAGKPLVNSINLKDGEAEFLRRAKLVMRYGAAVIVMLFDEQGQAATYERRIAIAERAYKLLRSIDFPPEDIVFDPNVLAVATGIPEHDRYALDFIRSIKPILALHPAVNVSAGVSNLSYSFRGNTTVRRAMHAVFLHLAGGEGMRLAIAEPDVSAQYRNLDPHLRETAAALLLNNKPGAAEELLRLAVAASGTGGRPAVPPPAASGEKLDAMASLVRAVIDGNAGDAAGFVHEALAEHGALEIVEGPLMEGMRQVGERFERGDLFLPHVLRSANVMKQAVAVLGTRFEALKKGGASGAGAKIILATVKGDVHDIGKNIVGTVLSCSGFDVVDLGVMTPCEKIIAAALEEKAAMVGLSGLVTPSLNEMIAIARELQRCGLDIPLLVGGAAASLVHTALKIAPEYGGPVVYVPDASRASETARALLSRNLRTAFLEKLRAEYGEARERHKKLEERRVTLTAEDARKNKVHIDWNETT